METGENLEPERRGRRFVEERIHALYPGTSLAWFDNERREVATVRIAYPGHRTFGLQVTHEALDQAASDPDSHPRLRGEIERQLQVSKSREDDSGIVREV